MHTDLVDVIDVKVLEDFKLFLTFEDGCSGIVDIAQLIPFKGIFKPLKNRRLFASVSINSDTGTIC